MDKRIKITTKDRVQHRLRIISGQVRKIEEMLSEDKCCVDIIHQSRAVQKALKEVDLLLVKDHLCNSVVSQIKNGQEDQTNQELLKLFEYK